MRDLAAELRGMLHAVGAATRMVEDGLIDGVGAAHERQQPAAAAHKRVDAEQVDAIFGKRLHDGRAPIWQLIGDAREGREVGGVMVDRLLEHGALALE